MPTSVELSDKLLKDARRSGDARQRSLPKQIEYWARLGQIAEQHPDLSFRFVQDMLVTVNDSNGDNNDKNTFNTATEPDSALI